jgi:hypothetical protein
MQRATHPPSQGLRRPGLLDDLTTHLLFFLILRSRRSTPPIFSLLLAACYCPFQTQDASCTLMYLRTACYYPSETHHACRTLMPLHATYYYPSHTHLTSRNFGHCSPRRPSYAKEAAFPKFGSVESLHELRNTNTFDGRGLFINIFPSLNLHISVTFSITAHTNQRGSDNALSHGSRGF